MGGLGGCLLARDIEKVCKKRNRRLRTRVIVYARLCGGEEITIGKRATQQRRLNNTVSPKVEQSQSPYSIPYLHQFVRAVAISFILTG